jgi:hypothetical protein
MANEYTGRFKWPIPPWNADWQKWQAMFKTFAEGADATTFAIMEHLTLIHHTLPTVEIVNAGPGVYNFTQVAAALFVSRTMQTQISVGPNDVELIPGALIGFALQPGAVGPQAVDWEQYTSQTDIDPTIFIAGIVNADYSITWFNAARLNVGVPTLLFSFAGMTGGLFMAGVGNPNGAVIAPQGTSYHDTAADIIYMNVDGISRWILT